MIRKEKKLYPKVSKISGKNKCSIGEIVKREKGTHAGCAVSNCRRYSQVGGKCLVRMERHYVLT